MYYILNIFVVFYQNFYRSVTNIFLIYFMSKKYSYNDNDSGDPYDVPEYTDSFEKK